MNLCSICFKMGLCEFMVLAFRIRMSLSAQFSALMKTFLFYYQMCPSSEPQIFFFFGGAGGAGVVFLSRIGPQNLELREERKTKKRTENEKEKGRSSSFFILSWVA